MSKEDVFQWEEEVRDNEVDLQGIVNNANYFVYMAHARHKHLRQLGIDFAAYHQQGYNLVLVESQLKFRDSLRSGDSYVVTSRLELQGKIRFLFHQEVIRKSDNKVAVTAVNTATCVDIQSGRPKIPDELRQQLARAAAAAGEERH